MPHKNAWSPEEDMAIKARCEGIITDEQLLAELPNRTKAAIYARTREFGFVRKDIRAWTFKEIKRAINLRERRYSYAQIAKILNRSKKSVFAQITKYSGKHGLPDVVNNKTEIERLKQLKIEQIIKLYNEGDNYSVITHKLTSSWQFVRKVIADNPDKLNRPMFDRELNSWTPEKDAMLREFNAQGFGDAKIARLMGEGRTQIAIAVRKHKLGITLPEEFDKIKHVGSHHRVGKKYENLKIWD